MRKFFIQLKIVYLQEKKLSRITFDHISKLGKEFLGQLFCPLIFVLAISLCFLIVIYTQTDSL